MLSDMRHLLMTACTITLTLIVLLASPSLVLRADGQAPRTTASRFVEIRSYNLKPGTRDRFHQLFVTQALPMLQRWKVQVGIESYTTIVVRLDDATVRGLSKLKVKS